MKYLTIFIILVSNLGLTIAPNSGKFTDSRDGNIYTYVEIDGKYWFAENLRYKTENSIKVRDSLKEWTSGCGEFYPVAQALKVCPEKWRLPTEEEIKTLIKLQKKDKININDTLQILLCGRIDNDEIGMIGMQNTFWIDAPLEKGHILHWHIFEKAHHLHTHGVTQANRKFPVRCVCEVDKL